MLQETQEYKEYPDLAMYRRHYPMLHRTVNGRPIIYFDNAATALKPDVMLSALMQFYRLYDSNVYRGWHVPSAQATQLYEDARRTVAHFLGTSAKNIVFCYNTTDGMYKLSNHLRIKKVLLAMDLHHSSMLPFTKFEYQLLKIKETGVVDTDDLRQKIDEVDAVVVNHVSNVTGVIQPIEVVGDIAHRHGKIVIVDGAQSVPHLPIYVERLPIDALVFSGHKLGGPYGSGAMYVAPRLHPHLQIGGGEAIRNVYLEGERIRIEYDDFPRCFEPGTPSIANQIAMAEVMKFLPDRRRIHEHEESLLHRILEFLNEKKVKYLGGGQRSSLVAMQLPDSFAYKLASMGICVRYGYHCAEPLHRFLKSPPTLRISLYFYNTEEEVDTVLTALSTLLDGGKLDVSYITYPDPYIVRSYVAVIPDICSTCPFNRRCFSSKKRVMIDLFSCPLVPKIVKDRITEMQLKRLAAYHRAVKRKREELKVMAKSGGDKGEVSEAQEKRETEGR